NQMRDYEKKRMDEKKLRQQAAADICAWVLEELQYNILADTDFLRLVAKFLIDKGDADVARAICKRREIKYDQAPVRGSAAGIVDGLEAEDVPKLIVEWLIQRELEFWAQYGAEHDKFVLCDFFGLNPKTELKQVAAKAKQAAKEKAKAKPKAKLVVE